MVSHENVYELQYAHDCALVAHTPKDLQLYLTTLHQAYSEFGLGMNPTETDFFYISFMGWVKLPYGTVVILPI